MTRTHTRIHTQNAQEELDKQVPIIDEVDKQLHNVTSRLKNNNMRLKGIVLNVSSPGRWPNHRA
jgi:hypothetical protein